jgi:uncharacterized protein (TIGR02996 family)
VQPPPDFLPLLRAICDRPDDFLPRLVFADYLDDRGFPERAAFIRAGEKLTRDPDQHMDWLGVPCRICDLNRVVNDYLSAQSHLKDGWSHASNMRQAEALTHFGSERVAVWRAGFVEYVQCPAGEWETARERFQWHPVRKATLTGTSLILPFEGLNNARRVVVVPNPGGPDQAFDVDRGWLVFPEDPKADVLTLRLMPFQQEILNEMVGEGRQFFVRGRQLGRTFMDQVTAAAVRELVRRGGPLSPSPSSTPGPTDR